jgi:hypothetical protein
MSAAASMPGWAAVLLIFAFASCLVIGPRLLWVAWRTREWPEFALGFFAVGIPVGNIGTVMMSRVGGALAPAAAFQLLAVLGGAAFYTATWRVFRPGSRWAQVVAVLGSLLLLGGWAGRVWIDGDPLSPSSASPSGLLLLLARCGAFGWWMIEALLYASKARKRGTLGLAEPNAWRRFAAWSLVGAAALAALTSLLVLALLGATPSDFPAVWVGLALGILLANASGYVAFFWPSLLGLGKVPERAGG